MCSPEAHGENLTAYEEALRARNTMHNRVVADAFIPAGGRPATIHEGNWEAYLRPDNGQPSSKLIVEGANLFLTAGARKAMHAATGIPIVKDSSANKCGVICSSYEIISSMLLSHDEFAAVKPELVRRVYNYGCLSILMTSLSLIHSVEMCCSPHTMEFSWNSTFFKCIHRASMYSQSFPLSHILLRTCWCFSFSVLSCY